MGDTSSLERSFKKTAQAARQFSGTVKEQASGAIVANVEQRQALEKLAGEYRRVANNAKKGSEVQVVAARLAEDAERKLAASYATVGRESRFAAGHASRFGSEVGKATRGAAAGTGIFRSLGRSIAFASGGFLAFATAGEFLRKSIDAAKEAQVTQRQLGAQFKASGLSLGDYQKRIDETSNKLSLLSGFQNDELKASFTTIFRSSQNVSKSLRDVGIAADLARAKHISLNAASIIIAKTEAGNTTLLRRQGIEIKKNATVEEALAAAHKATAGQARAGTTAQERFGAVLHNTEEIVGKALLPTLNKYLTQLAKWLTKMNESGRLQHDVERTTKALSTAIHDVGAVVHIASGAFNVFAGAVGGAKKAVELLAAAFVVLKAKAALTNSGVLAGGIRGVGREAEGSSKEVGLLGSALTNLPETIAVTLAITELVTQKQKDQAIGAVNKATGGFAFGPGEKARDGEIRDLGGKKFVVKTIGGQQFLVPLPVKDFGAQFARSGGGAGAGAITGRLDIPQSVSGVDVGPTLTAAQQRAIDLAGSPDNLAALRAQAAFDQKQIDRLRKRFAERKTGAKSFTAAITKFISDQKQTNDHINSIIKAASDAAKAKAKELADRLNQLFDTGISSALDRVQDLGVGKQVAALQAIGGQISSRIAATKDVLRRRALEDQLLGVIRQTKAVRQQIAQNVIDALSFNVDKASVTKGISDDLAALGAEQNGIKARIKSEGNTLELQRDLFAVQQQIVAARKQHADDIFASLSFRVDKAAVTKSAVDDLSALAAEQKFIQARIKSEGKTLELQQNLFDVRQKIVAARQQQRQNRADARNAAQFDALGLTATGDDRIPGVAALRRQLGTVDQFISGTFLDTKKTRSVLSHIKQVLSGGLGAAGRDVRSKVQGILKDLDDQLKNNATRGKFTHVDPNKILAGRGLTPEQIRTLAPVVAEFGLGRNVPASRSIPFGGGADIVVHNHVSLDGREVAANVTRHQQKHSQRRSSARRGPYAGRH